MALNQVIYMSLGPAWNRLHRPVLPQRWGADQRNWESKLGINVLQNHLTSFKSFFKIQILFFLRKRREKNAKYYCKLEYCFVQLEQNTPLCSKCSKDTKPHFIVTQHTASQIHNAQLHRHISHNFIDTHTVPQTRNFIKHSTILQTHST